MTDVAERPENCGACAFWRKLRDNEGVCCRWAPEATSHPEAVAHWPLTHRTDGCGDGVAAAVSLGADLRNCVYWRRPRARTPSGQSRRHADVVVGARRTLHASRASPNSRARTARFLARDPRRRLLRRRRPAKDRFVGLIRSLE